MDLGLAGALSGAGEAGTRSLSMAQAQYGASQLQAERDKMDNLRQDKLLAATAGENALNRTHAEEMQKSGFSHAEEMQKSAFTHAEAQTDKQIEKMLELHRIDAAERVELKKLARLTLKYQMNGVTNLLPLADGTVRVIMKDGSSSLLKDEKGNPVQGLKDVTKAKEILMSTNKSIIEHYQMEIARAGPLMDPATRKDIEGRMNVLQQQIAEWGGEKPVSPLAVTPPPSLNLGKYAAPSLSSTPGTRTVPMPSADEQAQMGRALVP